jgi:predicted permease
VGKTISFYGGPFTVIGVSAPGFLGTRIDSAPDVYVPFSMAEQIYPGFRGWFTPRVNFLEIMGRLKPEVSVKQAEAALSVIHTQWLEATTEQPDRLSEARAVQVVLLPGGTGLSSLRKQYSQPLLILLIACMNVANMLLARATGRQKEMSVRLAMGATRSRLVRQLVTESLLLALLGGALGILVAFECNGVLLAFLTQDVEAAAFEVQPDLRVLGFTLCLSLLTGLLFGLTPARQTTRPDLTPTLRGEVVWMRSPSRRFGLRDVLVVIQVALSLLLLVGAGLLVRTLQKLKSVDPGFNKENVLMLSFYPHMSGYTSKQTVTFFQQLVERVDALPAVRAVSLDRNLGALSGNSGGSAPMHGHGYQPQRGEDLDCYENFVGVGYFETMGIPLLLGRDFRVQENSPEAPKVAIINQTMARRFFGSDNPLGKRIGWGPLGVPEDLDMEVVGIVKDTKYESLRETNQAVVYIPYQQEPQGLMTLVVRTAVAPANMVAAIRREAQALDSRVPILQIKTLSQQLDESLRQERLLATLSSLFGGLALLLASVGLYGLISYSVTRRTHEIGIRMALGAQRANVLWLVLKETLVLVLIGVAIGQCAALASTRVISSMLFGMTATDPVTIIMATLLLVAVAAFAGYLPAKRASRVDPMVALRYE